MPITHRHSKHYPLTLGSLRFLQDRHPVIRRKIAPRLSAPNSSGSLQRTLDREERPKRREAGGGGLPTLKPVQFLGGGPVYAGDDHDVETGVIDGRIVMENGRLTTVDEEEILEKAQRAGERLVSELPYRLKPQWPVV